jgi:sulfate/thiosulfate transport system substrate-binding protein
MRPRWLNTVAIAAVAGAVLLLGIGNGRAARGAALLNVSYAPTQELYDDLDQQFIKAYQEQHGEKLAIKQSHGGSSRQALAVVGGLDADVVTLALPSDVDVLSKHGLISPDWAQRLNNNSQPYTSTIVFVVRKGNPKGIKDWPDLVLPGVAIVTPNPKTSGNGKLSFLAAWGSVLYRGGTEDDARDFVTRLYQHVALLGASATDSSSSFAYDAVGDVHLTWENEAVREVQESKGQLEIVYPPVSIHAEPSVAWVDANVARHHTTEESKAYLEFLYTDAAQETLAKYGYRPINQNILNKHADRLPPIRVFPITLIAKDWEDAQTKFFADYAIFDAIHEAKKNED